MSSMNDIGDPLQICFEFPGTSLTVYIFFLYHLIDISKFYKYLIIDS